MTMPVAVHMHARDGSWDIRLSEARINRMLSGDREQALYMGFWDKFGDFFRGIGGHKKAEVLEHVWDLLNTNQTTPENSVQTEGDKLKRSVHIFNKLRELADPAYQRVFNVRITGNTQNYPYLHVEFRIGDTLLKTQSVNDVANIECFLNNVDLRGAELSGVILNNITLVNVNLEGAQLYNAQLQCIKTQNVKLKNVKFGYVDLKDADLRGADLNLTDLWYANMTNAILPSNSEFDPADMKLMTTKGARFANEKELNNEFLNEETGAGTRTAEAIPSEQLVKAGDLSEEPAYQELDIRDDGYGFFRCVLLQNTKDDKWAQCSTKEVYNKINRTYINIFNPIADAFREMEATLLNVNNEKLAVIVSDLGKLLPNIVTDKGFYLWSPKEICMCHGINYEELSTKDVASLETFCNAVFTKLQSALTLNMDKSKGSYATIEDAHYTWHKKLDR